MPAFPTDSPFLCAASVEAWDAWFRWRDAKRLHDVSIEDTWQRIATALAAAEPHAGRVRWLNRFVEDMAQWRVLPDERLYQLGTGTLALRSGPLHATLNAACFVSRPGTPSAFSDYGAVARSAGLALRLLDDALRLVGRTDTHVRIGIMGIADALALLGLDYASAAACDTARRFAEALDAGCRQANHELAVARGATASLRGETPLTVTRRYPSPAVRRSGVPHRWRYRSITAIDSQRRLALLANDVSDALDPLPAGWRSHRIDAPGGARLVLSPGYAATVLQHSAPIAGDPAAAGDSAVWQAQLRLRAALQLQIDEPIDYPLALADSPTADLRQQVEALARQMAVATPRWPLMPAARPSARQPTHPS